MVVTLTSKGFIKRISAATYRLQRRGGKGVIGMVVRDRDTVNHILVADTHDNLLFFTSTGKVYCLKCYEIPEDSSRTAKGIALVNLLPVDLEDEVTVMLAIPGFPSDKFLLMANRGGTIKKTTLSAFASIRRTGIIAMGLRNKDKLISAGVVGADDEVILVSRNGQAMRFRADNLRTASRTSGGVRGIRLVDDHVVGMGIVFPDAYMLTVTEKGFGKLTPTRNYPVHNRGGKGIRAYRVSPLTGHLVAGRLVSNQGSLVMLSLKGNVVNIPMEQVSIQGRGGRGARVMGLDEDDSVVSLTWVFRQDEPV
jgi:DNA gyrase subunit A